MSSSKISGGFLLVVAGFLLVLLSRSSDQRRSPDRTLHQQHRDNAPAKRSFILPPTLSPSRNSRSRSWESGRTIDFEQEWEDQIQEDSSHVTNLALPEQEAIDALVKKMLGRDDLFDKVRRGKMTHESSVVTADEKRAVRSALAGQNMLFIGHSLTRALAIATCLLLDPPAQQPHRYCVGGRYLPWKTGTTGIQTFEVDEVKEVPNDNITTTGEPVGSTFIRWSMDPYLSMKGSAIGPKKVSTSRKKRQYGEAVYNTYGRPAEVIEDKYTTVILGSGLWDIVFRETGPWSLFIRIFDRLRFIGANLLDLENKHRPLLLHIILYPVHQAAKPSFPSRRRCFTPTRLQMVRDILELAAYVFQEELRGVFELNEEQTQNKHGNSVEDRNVRIKVSVFDTYNATRKLQKNLNKLLTEDGVHYYNGALLEIVKGLLLSPQLLLASTTPNQNSSSSSLIDPVFQGLVREPRIPLKFSFLISTTPEDGKIEAFRTGVADEKDLKRIYSRLFSCLRRDGCKSNVAPVRLQQQSNGLYYTVSSSSTETLRLAIESVYGPRQGFPISFQVREDIDGATSLNLSSWLDRNDEEKGDEPAVSSASPSVPRNWSWSYNDTTCCNIYLGGSKALIMHPCAEMDGFRPSSYDSKVWNAVHGPAKAVILYQQMMALLSGGSRGAGGFRTVVLPQEAEFLPEAVRRSARTVSHSYSSVRILAKNQQAFLYKQMLHWLCATSHTTSSYSFLKDSGSSPYVNALKCLNVVGLGELSSSAVARSTWNTEAVFNLQAVEEFVTKEWKGDDPSRLGPVLGVIPPCACINGTHLLPEVEVVLRHVKRISSSGVITSDLISKMCGIFAIAPPLEEDKEIQECLKLGEQNLML